MSRTRSRRELLQAGATGTGLWLGGLRVTDLLANVPSAQAASFRPAAKARPASEDELAYLSIAQASALIAEKKLSPVELVDACLSRIDRFEPAILAWITLLGDQARAAAKIAAAEIARGSPRSPLHGIPIGLKDLYDMKGVRTTAGSAVLADAPAAKRDATVVARLRKAGAIFLGKANTHEFAFGVWTPPTSNPWDTSRVPGGSSGGSAAALAAGMCLGATGTDTGGSIRIPSSLCGTVGIKPTIGRVSLAGVVPLSWSLDHAGPLTRSVEDCAIMLNAIAGSDRADPRTVDAPVPDFTAGLGRHVRGRVIGVPTSVFFDGVDPETERLVRRAIPVLESLGARVVPLDMPSTQYISGAGYLVIQLTEPLSAHEYFLRRRPQDYMNQTRAFLALGTAWHAQHNLRAQRIRTINVSEWVKVFGKVDAVLTPTTPRPAPTKQEAEATGVTDLINYTSFFDLNGCPSISVPAGNSSEGIPVGLMLSARPFDEVRLLQLAYAYQEATGFNRLRPPLH